MKTVILAGGRGTRLAEETDSRPKPMVEIGGRPILWHILKHYYAYGCNEFVIALGYKGEVIKRFFLEYSGLMGNISVDLANQRITHHNTTCEAWKVHLVDTGVSTNTAGRLRRVVDWIGDEPFMVTYGDGLSNVNIQQLTEFHHQADRQATVTAVRPPARFGGLVFDGNLVKEFTEKPQTGEGWINGGYFVFHPQVLKLIRNDQQSLEHDILPELARQGQLAAYKHEQFWQCMDTLRDRIYLEQLWQDGTAPWRIHS